MKIFKAPISLMVAFAMLMGISACGGAGGTATQTTPVPQTVVQSATTTEPSPGDPGFVKVNSIKLNKSNLTLQLNKTFKLKVTYDPTNTTQRLLAFGTSNKLVAKIDTTGTITAVAPGTATITVEVNGDKTVKATCVVTVPKPAAGAVQIKSLSLNATKISLNANKTFALRVTFNPSTTTQNKVKYTSANSNVAKVDANGLITGIAGGTTVITATSADKSTIKDSVTVTVISKIKAKPTAAPVSTTYANGLSKKTKVTLKMGMFRGGVGTEWMSYAISQFHKKFPNVTIKMESSPSIDTKITTKINAGNNSDMYDLFSTTRLTWDQYADNKKIVILDSLWNRKPYDTPGKLVKNVVYSAAYKYQVYKRLGHTYSLPYSLDVMGLFFDKNYFTTKKWNQAPRTYAQFTALCDKIKAAGIYPMTFYKGYLYGLIKPKEFELAAENGNTKFDYNFRHYIGKQYTSPEAIETYTNMYNMGKKGYFQPGSGTISNIISQMQLINHQAAMVVSGSWIQNEMKSDVPSGFKWGYMAMPFVSKTTSKLYVQQAQEDSLFIWAGKPAINKAWAKEFQLYLLNLNVQNEMTKNGLMSIRADFANSAARLANVQGVCQQILTLMSQRKIIPVNIGAHDVALKDPNGYGDIAYNLLDDNRVQITLGKKAPLPILQKCEEWFDKAQATGYK